MNDRPPTGTDGKQARRLKCGSALGHLFDHGCDAVTACIFNIVGLDGVGIGNTWFALMTQLVFQVAFFASNLILVHFNSQVRRGA